MTGQNERYKRMKEIFDKIEDVELIERKESRFRFTLYLTDGKSRTGLDALDLSVRSYHCLKRAGYNTIGDLAGSLARGDDIRKLRNCGTKCYCEIMEKLFLWNLENLPEHRRPGYIFETVRKNR